MSKRNIILILVLDVMVVAIAMYLIFGSETKKDEIGMNIEAVTDTQSDNSRVMDTENVIATWYAPLSPLTLGGVALQASIADTDEERNQGLSDTPYLPEGIVKLFLFEETQPWSFWMKDMNYPIDMIWLDENKVVVHVVRNATPESYPTAFKPPVPAKYVIESRSGFAEKKGITTGAKADWTHND